MNPEAPPFFPTFARAHSHRRVYSRAELKRIELSVVESIRRAPRTGVPSASALPVDFAALFARLPHAHEVLDVEHVAKLVEDGREPVDGTRALIEGNRQPLCPECANGPEACEEVRGIVAGAVRRAASNRLSAVLLQSGNVVWGLIQLTLVFEAKQSSLRLRVLAERHPNIVSLIREYLCGEGYHLPLPKITEHKQWQELNSILKFDWIRDNRTRVFTEISRRWKQRHTQFEQFVHFFGYRDAKPQHQVKNMLTNCAKPVFISILSGDIVAVVLLARLEFFVPPDYYWDIFPYFAETLLKKGSDGKTYAVMRHLCQHFHERQQSLRKDVYNPIEPPRRR
ncbi:hypothetical protein, conserved [Trypanosoma brucei gambiense DAL972]|uniref:Uncharacterized protein n=1 Tax=Trypanosoma brucei gambiense (strain MHOM/CI/86/DAL972) TaxID=679716 RepID=D0A4N9_TRYB9|nr:hypothetical protein, conserved [Trypanosoma brucei gambiense DAL972]CBH16233.1 hypothetical protein, conserved [Trypanosoma brucei gambiense DAL972]|eukprot:XP_011778497.1 hypothetical protein, conserved [Trypanosoma brucei gambiense DAL972]